jgi:hypothetical protein
MTTKVNRLAVVLKDEKDWYPFIELVQTAALKHKIWEYVNPNTKAVDLPQLIAPKEPTYSDIRPPGADAPASRYEDLNPGEVSRFQYALTRFMNAEKRFHAQEQALLDLREQIQGSVSEGNFSYTMDCPRPYDMLVNLKLENCPSTKQREQQLRDEYQSLFTLRSTQEVKPWLQKWEHVVKKCQDINLPET